METEKDINRLWKHRGRADGLVKFNAKIVLFVKSSSLLDKNVGEVAVNMPISVFIRTGQSCSGDMTPYAHMVELGSKSTQTAFNIAKAFPVRQLRSAFAHRY